METMIELFLYWKAKKKLWLFPLVLIMVGIAAIFVAAEGTVVAPLIYTLF